MPRSVLSFAAPRWSSWARARAGSATGSVHRHRPVVRFLTLSPAVLTTGCGLLLLAPLVDTGGDGTRERCAERSPSVTPTVLNVGTPVADAVARLAVKKYSVNVVPGTLYNVSLIGLTDSAATMSVCDQDVYVVRLMGNVSPKDQTFAPSGEILEIIVEGDSLTKPAANFVILTAQAPVVVQPIVGTSGNVPARAPTVGWVETLSTSRYATHNLGPGSHTVSIVAVTKEATLEVYADSTYSMQLDCTLRNFTSSARECVVTGPSVYFAVAAGSVNRVGAGYIMLVW